MLGLQLMLDPQNDTKAGIQDIHLLLSQAIEQYSSVDDLPYAEIIKQIVRFEGRPRRAKTRHKNKP